MIRRMIRRWVTMAVFMGACLLSACGSPCDKLATITCEKAGVNDPRCEEAQERAGRAGSAERAACARVLKIYQAATE